jgi:hypothetical protein
LHEARLADAGLAEDEGGGSVPARGAFYCRLEGGELHLSFQQVRRHVKYRATERVT